MINIEMKIKRLFYQLFISGYGRVELFFILAVISAFVFYPNRLMGAVFSFFLPLIFIGKKRGVFIASIILLIHLFSANVLLITGERISDNDKKLYSTTSRTLVSSSPLNVGDVVYGGYQWRKYASVKEGRFAGGYQIADEPKSFALPAVGAVLKFRHNLSTELFENTGGMLRLTQAIALGDKQFLSDDVMDKYLLTGLGHLLAISGLHVGLYTMVIYLLLSFLPRKLRLIPAGLFLLLIIPFTGFKIPVMRAGLIGFSIVTAKFFDQTTDYRKLLLFFAGIFILVSPAMIVSPSFMLSFSAVYGLLHMSEMRYPKFLELVVVGLVATLFILPAGTVTFGTFNLSSVLSTVVLVPVLSLQLVTFLLYPLMPNLYIEPLILLERMHLSLIDIFTNHFGFMFTLYHTTVLWGLLMAVFMYICLRLRILWFAMVLFIVPYLPLKAERGGYFPNMGASKGFVIVDDMVHIFYKGHHSDFMYKFLPYLADIGVRKADTGNIRIYTAENIFIPINNEGDDYGWVCVNEDDGKCPVVYHTRSGSFKCDDDKIHILYKNKCKTDKTYILNETGDLKIENQSK